MLKENWLFLCFEMMCNYFPHSYTVREDKRRFLDLAEHFYALESRIENHLSTEIKVFFYRTIGRGYSENGMNEEVLPYYKNAVKLLSEQDNGNLLLEDIIKTHFAISECYMNLDDYDNAIMYADIVIDYLTNDKFYENGYYGYLFIAYLRRAKCKDL